MSKNLWGELQKILPVPKTLWGELQIFLPGSENFVRWITISIHSVDIFVS